MVAHFHYIMVGGAIMGYMGGLHFWWPKMTGRMYSEFLSRIAAILVFVGFNLTFFPQFVVGYLGMPRRYHAYPDEFQVLNVMSSAGATVLGLGYLLPVIYLLYSLKKGAVAGPNPWGASGLEWHTQSPPLTENFVEVPEVISEPYEYDARRRQGEAACLTRSRTPTHDHAHAAHHPALQHQFDTMAQQKEAAVLGMWVFLLTEILFFGGLFIAYMIYRIWYFDAFAEASRRSSLFWGGLNTAVLIGSSLTMAMAVRSAQTNKRKATVNWLILTIDPRRGVPRRQGHRVRRQVRAPPRARPELRVGRRARGAARPRRASMRRRRRQREHRAADAVARAAAAAPRRSTSACTSR